MKKRFMGSMVVATLLLVGCGSSSTKSTDEIYDANQSLVLNELKVNIPEDLHEKQYIELRGTGRGVRSKIFMS